MSDRDDLTDFLLPERECSITGLADTGRDGSLTTYHVTLNCNRPRYRTFKVRGGCLAEAEALVLSAILALLATDGVAE